jgi:hypothetical protein
MDVYPSDYLVHNLPLIVLSGLAPSAQDQEPASYGYPLLQEKGVRITSDLPLVSSPNAGQLLRYFLELDASHTPWSARTFKDAVGSIRFQVKVVGRVGQGPFYVALGSTWTICVSDIKLGLACCIICLLTAYSEGYYSASPKGESSARVPPSSSL